MKVKSVMTKQVATCLPGDSLGAAAEIMWNKDCGIVPVVEAGSQKLLGLVTDRDLAMAALLSNRPTDAIRVGDAMTTKLFTCREEDDLREAHDTMREHKVRRVPVVDDKGRLAGLVSLSDLAREAFSTRAAAAARRQRECARTLAAVSQQREAGTGGFAF
ncbi:MAG: CBS domain-containing protein [Planctomycetes bacterium]|nr:CBS domain-containing protein [Planctomycetota bacterium]